MECNRPNRRRRNIAINLIAQDEKEMLKKKIGEHGDNIKQRDLIADHHLDRCSHRRNSCLNEVINTNIVQISKKKKKEGKSKKKNGENYDLGF